jgi:hypothetical protein
LIGIGLCVGGYSVAHRISGERLRAIEVQQAAELSNLQTHSNAQKELERAHASVAALRAQGIDAVR